MKKLLKSNLSTLIMILGELAIGVLLLIRPVGFTRVILMALGAVLAVRGLLGVIKYFRTEAQQAAREQALARNLAVLLVGSFCLFRSEWFIATFPALTVIYGVLILFTSLYKVQQAVDLWRLKTGNPLISGLSALLTMVFGLVTLLNPFATVSALWIFIGITLLAEAVVDAAALFAGQKKKQ